MNITRRLKLNLNAHAEFPIRKPFFCALREKRQFGFGGLELSIKVKDVMVQNVKTADIEETVLTATEIMNRHEIGCIVVVNKEKPVGIVTERDLLKRVLFSRKDPGKIRLHGIMSKPLVYVAPNITLNKAAHVMIRQRIKKLIVMKNERLMGILSLTDVASALRKNNAGVKLSLKNAPSNFKKTLELYDVDLEERRCPQIVIGGSLINCLGPKCMWFDENGCRGSLRSRD